MGDAYATDGDGAVRGHDVGVEENVGLTGEALLPVEDSLIL